MGRPKEPRTKERYYVAAKKHGYRARSAYKLRQIAKKYKLLENVDRAVDLCASPGGWSQVLHELHPNLEIIAVDLAPMRPIEGVKFIQGDITEPAVVNQIFELIRGAADLVVSDCSPKVSGHWELDVTRQLGLAEATIEIGLNLLSSRGKVVAKVFQGPGFEDFLRETRTKFKSVRLVKPDASRKTSAEIYLLAIHPKPLVHDEPESD
jgi:23S rRNA (uridine2552-2'-O)-methyltransferase